ncbi:MAG: DUF4294 domain-containing protein [Salinivirgaceae bacterium]|nr:DUF4294 domain-containing protein [Salinivirgaceae bacterium]MDD4745932.1 DUF4294 domain-containing protein [Salinivirgaceae bacterium]MDY0279740.1 DUF4294 domain-containing protein [Salinivirgaceae bacterium]
MLRKIAYILFLLGVCSTIAQAQFIPWSQFDTTKSLFPVYFEKQDTIPIINLPTVVVYPQRILGNDRFSRDYIILALKVRKVYPYSKLAVRVLDEIKDTLVHMEQDRARRRYIKAYERALLAEYKVELVKMKVSEGRILIKLIDRETGHTSYDLVEQMRGTLSAYFWQGLARLFGETLKVNYDPKGADKLIEEIVVKIEQGNLEPLPIREFKLR